MGFIRPGGIKFAQPSFVVFRPFVEVLLCGPGKRFRPQLFAQGKKFILQCLGQIGLRDAPDIGNNKNTMQKTGHQRRMLGAEQPPGGVVLAEQIEGCIIEGHVLRYPSRAISVRSRPFCLALYMALSAREVMDCLVSISR